MPSTKKKIPLRVLLVEDNPDDAELVLRELRRHGFEPDWRAGRNLGAQHIAGRNLRDPIAVLQPFGLRALAGARWAKNDQSHVCFRASARLPEPATVLVMMVIALSRAPSGYHL